MVALSMLTWLGASCSVLAQVEPPSVDPGRVPQRFEEPPQPKSLPRVDGIQVPSTAFAGSCLISAPRYGLTGDKVSWSMRLGSGQSCTRGFRLSSVALDNVTLSSSPQSGEVTLKGPAFTYTAKSDFQGADLFTVVISGSIARIPGRSTIHVDVLVVGVLTTIDPQPQDKTAAQTKVKNSAAVATQKLAIQVDERNDKLINLALNNAKNVIDYYKEKGETVAVEIVTFGPGLHMLRADTSPVKDRIAVMALENPELAFVACANTQAKMAKAENKPITLISEAKMTTSGVVRLIELQEQGYAYIRP